MRSTLFKYSILLYLGLAFILNACAPGDPGDPPVTPDTTNPSTLKVTVTINEDQNASDGKSVVTLSFRTNEIQEDNSVIFTHGERVNCNGHPMALGNAVNYSVRMNIPPVYACDYHLNNNKPALIFSVPKRSHLSPALHVPVGNSPFIVTYNPDSVERRCALQGVASDAANNISGSSVASDGRTYTGVDVSSLNGAGNLMMIRTCMCPPSNKNLDSGYHCPLSHGNTGDNKTVFDSINITYKSTATLYVTWVPPNTPTTSTPS